VDIRRSCYRLNLLGDIGLMLLIQLPYRGIHSGALFVLVYSLMGNKLWLAGRVIYLALPQFCHLIRTL